MPIGKDPAAGSGGFTGRPKSKGVTPVADDPNALSGLPPWLMEAIASQASGSGSSFGSSQSTSSTPVMAPALDLLQQAQERRAQLAELLTSNLPAGQRYYLGFEPNGLADILMGVITGQGPEGPGMLPDDQRVVRRQEIPNPSLQEDFGDIGPLAMQILDMMKVIQTGQSSSSQGSQQTSTETSAPATAAASPTVAQQAKPTTWGQRQAARYAS